MQVVKVRNVIDAHSIVVATTTGTVRFWVGF